MSTIEKALDILETINSSDNELGLADLARLTGGNRPTAYRICAVLVKRGYLNQKQKRGKYSLGYKFMQYCHKNTLVSRIKDTDSPFLQTLCTETSESVNLTILDGIFAKNIAILSAERLLQVVPQIEKTLALHCTATGKILLAFLPEEKKETVIHSIDLSSNTDNTITDIVHLKKELAKVRSEGIAFDNEEYMLGVRSVAAPVRDDMGDVLAAISLIGPSIRMGDARLMQLTAIVKKCALDISRALGSMGEQDIRPVLP